MESHQKTEAKSVSNYVVGKANLTTSRNRDSLKSQVHLQAQAQFTQPLISNRLQAKLIIAVLRPTKVTKSKSRLT